MKFVNAEAEAYGMKFVDAEAEAHGDMTGTEAEAYGTKAMPPITGPGNTTLSSWIKGPFSGLNAL